MFNIEAQEREHKSETTIAWTQKEKTWKNLRKTQLQLQAYPFGRPTPKVGLYVRFPEDPTLRLSVKKGKRKKEKENVYQRQL